MRLISILVKPIQKINPVNQIAFSFFGIIIFGGLLLKLPFAVENGHTVSWIDAFFVATSSTCVTGLSPIDIGTTFSLFGEIVIMALMQVGGTGVMVLSSYLFLSLGRGMSIRHKLQIQDTFSGDYDVNWRVLVSAVVHYVVIIELIGALILALLFLPKYPLVKALYYGLFHSVSAFCNGGLSLFPDNLISYRDNLGVNLTVVLLIILGGIGFFVMWEVKQLWVRRKERYRLSLHSRVALITTISLIIFGTIAIWILEWRNGALGPNFLSHFWPSFFQSVTPRTAGFNTVDMSLLGNDTVLLIIFLMFIGASPGSCGGGIKTTTFAVIFALFWSRIRGGNRTNLFKRTLSSDLIGRSLGVAAAAIAILLISNVLLMMTDFSSGNNARARVVEYLFESVSALGTVGLSLNFTSSLNSYGKVIIMVLMYFGRIGVMTMFLQAVGARRHSSIEYAEEGVMIG